MAGELVANISACHQAMANPSHAVMSLLLMSGVANALGVFAQMTEAMRKRKQGDKPDLPQFKDVEVRSPRSGKKKKGGELTPKVLLLSLHNSLAAKEDDHVCRVSLFAPFWIDNRTGFDLIFKDLDAPSYIDRLPFLRKPTVTLHCGGEFVATVVFLRVCHLAATHCAYKTSCACPCRLFETQCGTPSAPRDTRRMPPRKT